MALKPHYPSWIPYGEYDVLDSERTSFKGGEVCTFAYLDLTNSDKAAKDVFDGYVSYTTKKRVVVTKTLVADVRPLFLADEGITGYGTLLGQVVGGIVGQVNVNGTVLGPHTTEGSGKMTLWDKGLYRVTLDSVDTDPLTGLQPTNTTLTGGDKLYARTNGQLTPDVSEAFETDGVGRFIEFGTNRSYVTTPKSYVAAYNSPVPGAVVGQNLTEAVVYFDPPSG